MRLFVSVDFEGLEPAIEDLQSTLAAADGVRPTDSSQVHITLKFLGETPAAKRDAIERELEAAVEESGLAPFEAEIGGLGVFPHLDYISVIWVGVREGSNELTQLHELIEEKMVALGFDPEEHDFTPHATIARMDHAGGKSHVQEVVRNSDPDIGTIRVADIQLKESELQSDGPEYSTVESFPLADA